MKNVADFDDAIAAQEKLVNQATGTDRIQKEARLEKLLEGRDKNIQYIQDNRPVFDEYRGIMSKELKATHAITREALKDQKLDNPARFDAAVKKVATALGETAEKEFVGAPVMDWLASEPAIKKLLLDGVRYNNAPKAKPSGLSRVPSSTPQASKPSSTQSTTDTIEDLQKQLETASPKESELILTQLMSLQSKQRKR